MEYTILYGTPSILEREVMYHIKRGFEPLGGVSNFNQTLAQAMVKKPLNNTVEDRQTLSCKNYYGCPWKDGLDCNDRCMKYTPAT